jgi:hypothetical protein
MTVLMGLCFTLFRNDESRVSTRLRLCMSLTVDASLHGRRKFVKSTGEIKSKPAANLVPPSFQCGRIDAHNGDGAALRYATVLAVIITACLQCSAAVA